MNGFNPEPDKPTNWWLVFLISGIAVVVVWVISQIA